MFATTRAFLERLIDYAGMFPPAGLAMPEALRRYSQYAGGPDAWMLGRFVCRADQLDALRACAGAAPRLAVAALGRGGRDETELAANLAADLRDIAAFRDAAASRTVDVMEVPLPAGLPDVAFGRILSVLATARLRTFFEVPPSAFDCPTPVAEALAHRQGATPAFGLKIRCGGATAAAIPTPEAVAVFICRCRDLRLPWKATAGLHHPLRHYDPALQTCVHGFVNVFGAGILARTESFDAAQVAAILREESPAAFRFTGECFGYREWSCTAEQVADARRWLPSFGSCCFDQPRTDLRARGLIQ